MCLSLYLTLQEFLEGKNEVVAAVPVVEKLVVA
jgi:hypothetical protein